MTTTADVLRPEPKSGTSAGFITRLTTGTGAFDILGKRRYYYIVSAVLVVLSILLIIFRGFNFGIDFAGGTRIQMSSSTGATTDQVAEVISSSTGVDDPTVVVVGTGGSATIQARTSTLSAEQVVSAKQALSTEFGIPVDQISDSAVSETWGGEISRQAIIALIVFLAAAGAFLWLRYERRVAIGALTAVLHDVIVTAGIYSLVGFEVTPATVIGLLAILGFSLYDTVVVYDKVQENTKGLTSLLRRTFDEAANLAINQTLMRSINTSLIALLPVAGLLVAGVAILGSGTLRDLALVQLVGMIVSGYSSVFLAVPIAVDLRERDPAIKAHTARVLAKRKADGLIVDADGDPIGRVPGYVAPAATKVVAGRGSGGTATGTLTEDDLRAAGISSTPRPGARPQPGTKPRPGSRPTGKGGRPTGKRPR